MENKSKLPKANKKMLEFHERSQALQRSFFNVFDVANVFDKPRKNANNAVLLEAGASVTLEAIEQLDDFAKISAIDSIAEVVAGWVDRLELDRSDLSEIFRKVKCKLPEYEGDE